MLIKIIVTVVVVVIGATFLTLWFFIADVLKGIKGEESDIVLMSPFEGTLTLNGKPLPNHELRLWIGWEDKKGKYFTYVTNADGKFSIPEHKVRDKLSPYAQLVIRQKITTNYDGESYNIWCRSRLEPELYSELGGRPVNLVCELTAKEKIHHGESSVGATICVWERLEKDFSREAEPVKGN